MLVHVDIMTYFFLLVQQKILLQILGSSKHYTALELKTYKCFIIPYGQKILQDQF